MLLAATAAFVALAAGASAAAGGWSAPIGLSEQLPPCVPAKCARFPELAMNARGDAVAVWRRYYGFQMSRPLGFDCSLSVRRGGKWSAPEPAPGGGCPSLAVDAEGNVVAVWTATQGGRTVVLAQVRTLSGRWLRGQRISAADADASSARVVAGGRTFVAAWASEQDDGVSLLAAQGRLRFGQAQRVGKATVAASVRLAANTGGDAVVGWSGFDHGRTTVLVAVRPAVGRWQAPQTLASSSRSAGISALAIDDRGNVLAAWSKDFVGYTSFRPAGGRFGAPRLLAREAGASALGFDAQGNALVAWVDRDHAAMASFRTAGGRWQLPQQLSSTGVRVSGLAAALAPGGAAVAVWEQLAFGASGRENVVQGSVRPAGGRFGPRRDLSARGLLGGSPSVEVDRNGNAVALWEGLERRVEAASYAR